MNQDLVQPLLIILLLAVLTYTAFFLYWALTTDARRRSIVVEYVETKPHFEFYGKTSANLQRLHRRIEEGKIKVEGLTEKQQKKTEQDLKIYGAVREFMDVTKSTYYVQNFIKIPDENFKQYIFETFWQAGGARTNTYRDMYAVFISQKEKIPGFILLPTKDQKNLDEPDQIIFEDSPEFSGMYFLRSDDPETVRRFFNPELQQFLIQNPHFKLWVIDNSQIKIEGSDSKWFRSGTVKDKYIVTYLETVEELFTLLRKSI